MAAAVRRVRQRRADGRLGQSGECTHSAHDLVARSEGKGPYRCASRRGAREACGSKPAPRHAVPVRKGEYGPPLATGSLTTSPMPKLPATTARQRERGFQLSTAEGVVVTKAGRVFKLEEGGEDFVFEKREYPGDGELLVNGLAGETAKQ